jgi:hypothetical protein
LFCVDIVRFPALTVFGLFVVGGVVLFGFSMVTRFSVDVHQGGKFEKSRKTVYMDGVSENWNVEESKWTYEGVFASSEWKIWCVPCVCFLLCFVYSSLYPLFCMLCLCFVYLFC